MGNVLKMSLTPLLTPLLVLLAMPAYAALEDSTVMALSAVDGRAVVKTKDGKMSVLKVGDSVPDSKAKVMEISADRLVVEDLVTINSKKVKQTVWMYKPTEAGGKSRIQRLVKEAPNNTSASPGKQNIKLNTRK